MSDKDFGLILDINKNSLSSLFWSGNLEEERLLEMECSIIGEVLLLKLLLGSSFLSFVLVSF